MEKYIISSMSANQYSDSTDVEFIVFLIHKDNPTVKLQLIFKHIKNENEVIDIIKEFNNPLRLKNAYKYKPISKCDKSDTGKDIFCTIVERYSFECHVLSMSEEHLSNFIDFINNPSDVDVNILIKEHNRLSNIINNHHRSIDELKNKRRLIEYRIWNTAFNRDVVEDDR